MALKVIFLKKKHRFQVDLTSEFVCRVLNFMAARGYRQCVPRLPAGGVSLAPLLDFSSGVWRVRGAHAA